MKVKEATENYKLKSNEYRLRRFIHPDIILKIDSQKIHTDIYKYITSPLLISKNISKEKFKKFVNDNKALFDKIVEEKIQDVVNAINFTYCFEDKDFKQVRKSLYRFGNTLEEFIVHLKEVDVRRAMIEQYKKEMNL